MSNVFISYRRSDTASSAGRIYDRIANEIQYGIVFFDVSTIKPGDNFVAEISRSMKASDLALILIGDRWLELDSAGGQPRIWNEDDYVRIEIRSALVNRVRVVPVLVDNGRMPQLGQLPEDICEITVRNALHLRHETFDEDAETIISYIKSIKKRRNRLTLVIHGLIGFTLGALAAIAIATINYLLSSLPLTESIGLFMTNVLLLVIPKIGSALAIWRCLDR